MPYQTESIVCPACSRAYPDADDLKRNWGTITCPHCEKKFRYERDWTVTYSTFPLNVEPEEATDETE